MKAICCRVLFVWALLMGSASFSHAVIKNWTGLGSVDPNDWHDPDNWTPSGVPGPSDDVFINLEFGAPSGPSLYTSAVVKSLNLDFSTNSTFIYISPGVTLTVNGNVTLSSGSTLALDNATLRIGGSLMYESTPGFLNSSNGGTVEFFFDGVNLGSVVIDGPTTFENLYINKESLSRVVYNVPRCIVAGGSRVVVTGDLTITNSTLKISDADNTQNFSSTQSDLEVTGALNLLGGGVLDLTGSIDNDLCGFSNTGALIAVNVGGTPYNQTPSAYTPTALAGNGYGFADGTGTSANFRAPMGIERNFSNGTYFVADALNHAIRIMTSSGGVTTLTGTGVLGLVNGELATAQFNNPCGMAYDIGGNILYVADRGNHCIRKIDLNANEVTTLAGNGLGYADGIGSAALFNSPVELELVGTNLYVSDHGNHCIRKIDLSTATVTTFSGTNSPGYTNGSATSTRYRSPWGLAYNGASTIYVADHGNHTIRNLSIIDGSSSTFAGNGTKGFADGTGTAARFAYPTSLALQSAKLYVTDHSNHSVRSITSTGITTTVSGDGSAGSQLSRYLSPVAIAALGSTELLVSDGFTHKIKKLTP